MGRGLTPSKTNRYPPGRTVLSRVGEAEDWRDGTGPDLVGSGLDRFVELEKRIRTGGLRGRSGGRYDDL